VGFPLKLLSATLERYCLQEDSAFASYQQHHTNHRELHELMADPVQFYVDDTSPSISYFPFGDTFSLPNLTAGWNPYFDQTGFASTSGGTGNGTSYHVTSRDGASLSVQWKGASGT
jgi:hypothetical protein